MSARVSVKAEAFLRDFGNGAAGAVDSRTRHPSLQNPMARSTRKAADPPEERNRTRSFFGWEQLWDGVSFELQDVHWNKGGIRIFIHGTGHAVVQVVNAKNVETRYELRLKREQVAALREAMIREDL